MLKQSLAPLTLLVIEDDDIDAQFIQRTLKNYPGPLEVVRKTNGAEALAYLDSIKLPKRAQPMIILLDLNMPVMNGFEFLKKIREDKKYKNLIVFVLSTSNYWEDKAKSYNHNIAGYLQKRNLNQNKEVLKSMLSFYFNCVEFPPAEAIFKEYPLTAPEAREENDIKGNELQTPQKHWEHENEFYNVWQAIIRRRWTNHISQAWTQIR